MADTSQSNGSGGRPYKDLADLKQAMLRMITEFRQECNEVLQNADLTLPSYKAQWPSAWEFWQPWRCDCVEKRPRLWTLGSGIRRVALQCVACGEKYANGVKNADYPNYLELPELDEVLPKQVASAFQEARNQMNEYLNYARNEHDEKRKGANQLFNLSQDGDWWARYNQYLLSPEWQDKRQRVFERDNHRCQACLRRPAEHAHHLTYDRVFNEPLFDLIAVCSPCHRALHPHMEAA